MTSSQILRGYWFCVIPLAVSLLTGCEKVNEIAGDVQKRAGELTAEKKDPTEADSATAPVLPSDSTPAPTATESAPPPQDPAPPPEPAVDPQILIKSFLQANPRERKDAEFLALASLPSELLDSIEIVTIASSAVTSQGLDILEQCRQLNRLEVNDIPLTDEMLTSLAKLTQVESLSLRSTQFSNDAILQLETLKQLKELDLSSSTINDAGALLVPRLPALEVLDLSATNVTGASFSGKPKLVQLRVLHLDKSQFGVGLGYFKGLQALEELLASNSQIDDRSLLQAGGWPNLKRVAFFNCNISDVGIKASLSTNKNLVNVNLRGTKVGNPTMGMLRFNKDLEYLLVTDTNVDTNAGVALKKILPDAEIVW